MKEVISKLERILELTATHGICFNGTDNATDEHQLHYVESKIRLNAVQALSLLYKKHIESDKPKRTKVEYVKVTDSIFDLRDSFESKMLHYKDIDDKFYVISSESQLVNCFDSNCVYRRIETPIEWWEDASEFVNQSDDDNCSSIMEGKLHVNATLTQDQWCDFGRILLEYND